jgi:hypothetical protein
MANYKTQKLSTDDYIRPQNTFTDKLTEKDIENKLEDYKEEDIYKIPLSTHVRYFKVEKDHKKFRTGGLLYKNDGLPDYVVLSNGRKTWSVQVKDAIFFRRMTSREIKKEYEEYIVELEKKNKQLKELVKHLKKQLKYT